MTLRAVRGFFTHELGLAYLRGSVEPVGILNHIPQFKSHPCHSADGQSEAH